MKSPGIIIAPVIAFLILTISCPHGFAETGTKTEAGAKTDTGTNIGAESKTETISITETESKAWAESGFWDEPGTSPDRGRHSDVQFVSANVDSFHVLFGYDNMLAYHLVPVKNRELVSLDQPYTRAIIIAHGYRDKELAIPRSEGGQAVLSFTMSEATPERMAETRYPMIHWNANLFLVAEPGTRFELDAAPLRGSDASIIHRMEYWNQNTLLLRMWPGTYTITAHYANGDSRSEEVGVTFDRLRYQPMFQNPLQSDLQRARWIPGGGQNLKREYRKELMIQAVMAASLSGSVVSWAGYYIERNRYYDSRDIYRTAPGFSDFDALYDDVRKHRQRTNTFNVLRYAFGAALAGSYVYNVIDGGRAPENGFRQYRGIDPFLDMDQYTGVPTGGIRYSRN